MNVINHKTKAILVFITLFVISCNSKKSNITQEISKNKNTNQIDFKNSIQIDTTLIKGKTLDFLIMSNSTQTDSIFSRCNCETKKNEIKIQLKTIIPTRKELDTISNIVKKKSKFLELISLGRIDEVNGQFKFLTISIKDSIVESINLYSKSTEKEYHGQDFDSLTINHYKIRISKFDYSIASNVYGEFKLRLSKPFGFLESDTILRGKFLCNNLKIEEKNEIKQWDIKASYKKREENRGFQIYD